MKSIIYIYSCSIAMALLIACGVKANKNVGEKKQSTTLSHAMTQGTENKTTHIADPIKILPTEKAEVEKLLTSLIKQRKQLTTENLVLRLARHFIGVPYIAHTLDRNKDEQMVVNLREMDCTTYLENVVALSLCVDKGKTTADDFISQLQQIRYKGGKLSYENRLHYYQWWVTDNEEMGFVKEISMPNPPFTATQRLKINYMSENFQAYDMLHNAPERVKAIKAQEDKTNGTVVRYIPKGQLKNTELLRKVVKDGDIIALVTNKKNLDTTHLGIAVWHKDGLHLLNASSLKKNGKQVVEPTETLYQYLMARPYNPGIRVARLKLSNIGN